MDKKQGRIPFKYVRFARLVGGVRADVSFAIVDAFLVAMSYLTALVLRFIDGGLFIPGYWWRNFLVFIPVVVIFHLVANITFGAYGHVWKFASIAEAQAVVLANLSAGTALLILTFFERNVLNLDGPLPVGVIVLGSLLSLSGTGLVRFRSRLFSFNRRLETSAKNRRRTLVVGTSWAAVDLVRRGSEDRTIEFIGFVEINGGPINRRLAGLAVLGGLADVPRLVGEHTIDEVVVAESSNLGLVRTLVDLCLSVDVRLRIVPDHDSVFGSKVGVTDVRDIEPEDLLQRVAVDTDIEQLRSLFKGRRILVTGAGGSIGSEVVKQLLAFEAAEIIALDHDETHLHEAKMRWSAGVGTDIETVLCDIREASKLSSVFERYAPEIVFHAAAHKHVPILELHPDEAVKTNVVGTANLLTVCEKYGVDRFVLISTDKAASPASVMGATKRVAEMLVQAADERVQGTVFTAVRFGNVLGSRGSVVPTFREQIRLGGPLTVTDPEMTRYFMTTVEAVGLVLQASALAEGGELFVLDMGEPVKIVDLARRLIRLAGLVPGRDIEIVFTGRRPGEKLNEILTTVPLGASAHPKINVARVGWVGEKALSQSITELTAEAFAGDDERLRESLFGLVEGELVDDDIVVDLRESVAINGNGKRPTVDSGAQIAGSD